MSHILYQRKCPNAFSLVEVLVVIGIIALLAVFAVPAVSSLLESSRLNTTVNQVADQIALARQAALAQNRRVEIRFYKLTNSTDGLTVYRGMRSHVISDNGTSTPLSALSEIQEPLIISSNSGWSTVFRAGGNSTSYQGTEDLPKAPGTAYSKFSFLPNGRTDFGPGDNPFLTLLNPRASSGGALPPNYAVLQIDAITGNIRVFRPH